jgi:hypothetical protein
MSGTIKNMLLFVSIVVSFTLATILLMQRSPLVLIQRNPAGIGDPDSTKKANLYSYTLAYGNYITPPLKKEMLVCDSNGRSISLGKLFTGKRMVFHFDETNCFTCVEKFLPYVSRLSEKLGKGNVIIIGSYQKRENLFINLRDYDLAGVPIYNLDPEALRGTRLDELNAPYIFETDSALEFTRFFIPEKTMPDLSEKYCAEIKFN